MSTNKISPPQRILAEVWFQKKERNKKIITVDELKNIFQNIYSSKEIEAYLQQLLEWQAISITKENEIAPKESFDIGQKRKKTTYEINLEEREEDKESGVLIK